MARCSVINRYRFALIGCGRVAEKYLHHLLVKPIERGTIVAVCDVNGDRAQKVGEKFRLPWYDSIEALVENGLDSVDAFLVLTPSGLHSEHVVSLAPFGRHIVVEKPMALTLEDADRMIEACDRHGVRLFVVKQNRWNAPIKKVRSALEAGLFGKMVLGTVRVRWCRDQAYYNQDDWRGTWLMDGGVFSNQASHHIDLLEWMLGRPSTVYAAAATQLVDIEAEDTGIATIKFESGALGIIEATTATRPKNIEGSLSLLGEKGMVEIGGFAVNEIVHWEFSSDEPEITASRTDNETPPDVYGFGHRAYLEHVVECLNRNSPALVDGLEGRKSLELITAIYESVATGEEVQVGYAGRHSKLGKKL